VRKEEVLISEDVIILNGLMNILDQKQNSIFLLRKTVLLREFIE
jgi:hypothetical protein